jgi:CRISPR-associated protein, MJ1666 family
MIRSNQYQLAGLNWKMQTKKIIYQIGRLDHNIITDYKFQIYEKTYESKLSSFALKKHFDESGDPSKVILIYPYSILLSERRPKFNNKLDEFFNKLIAKDAEEINQYLKDPYAYLEYHPHSKEANDFIVIHSIGEYMGIEFSTALGDIVLRILIDMMQRYLEEPFEEMYLDISSGLNVYASAMIEAGRVFLTLISLQKMSLQKPYLKVYISFSEPIIPANTTKTYEIYKDFQLDVKAFFQFPENPNKDNIEKLNLQTYKNVFSAFVDSIFNYFPVEENSKLKDKTNEIVYKAYLFYSALKNNTPLALYHLFSDKNFRYDEEEIDDITKELIRLLKNKFNSNFIKSPELNLNAFKKMFITLSLAKGMIRVLKDRLKNITQKGEIFVSLKYLEDTFTGEHSLYKPFGLDTNKDYLKNELKKKNIEKEVRKSKKNGYKWVNHKWEKLYDLVEYNNQRENNKNRSNNYEFDERNFKAHCGFENNITEVSIINNKDIIIRYSPKNFGKVVKTLLKS